MSSMWAEPEPITELFRRAFRMHPAGVAIVTADDGRGPVAMTVSSVASVSTEPLVLVFSASAASSSTRTLLRAETVVIHFLTADDVELAKLGARSGGDRFGDHVHWGFLPTGEPYYPDPMWLRGTVIQRIDVNGTSLMLVRVIEGKPQQPASSTESNPLVYHNRTWHVLSEKSGLPAATSPICAVYGRDE